MEQLSSRHILPKTNNAVAAYVVENLSTMTMAAVAPVLGGLATGIPTKSILSEDIES